jgi:hypothetical protein
MVNPSRLREQIEKETGTNFGIHKTTAFLTFRITKTDSHNVTYDPGLRPDWVLQRERHPKPTAPYRFDSSSEEPDSQPVLVGAKTRTRRKIRGHYNGY